MVATWTDQATVSVATAPPVRDDSGSNKITFKVCFSYIFGGTVETLQSNRTRRLRYISFDIGGIVRQADDLLR